MMPLWTTDTPPETCGWAFFSDGTPWVAQRVCAIPMSPARPCEPASFASSATRPVERTRRNVARDPAAVPSRTATPAESYPRYSSRFSPSMRMGTMLRLAIAPTIPHMRFAFRLLLLCRPLPARNRHLLHAREGQLACRSVLGERGSCTERRAPAHAHRSD